jgi:cardiolipin synthase A/B
MNHNHFRPGNRVDILQNGDEIFPAMLEAISGAQTSIEFLTYVYWHSRVANEFAAALCERARAGVKVRLLVDAVGGAVMNTRTVWQLERAGVQVSWFRPLRWPYLRKLNNRTHRKILLVDGHAGFTGGVGIADEWAGAAHSPRHWRELHCRIEGPAVVDLFAGFAENWFESTRELIPPRPAPPAAGRISIQTTTSSAGPRPTAMEQLFHEAIAAAGHRLWIATAYFVPGLETAAALIAAARRGVDVRVLTNGPLSNHKITRLAGRASYTPLLEAGVKIYEYQPTVLHSKVMTIDSSWATLGSTNIDNRSLVLNDELNISFTNPGLVKRLDQIFLADLEQARAVTLAERRTISWLGHLAETGSSVFRDQL